ncbi:MULTISPECIES: acyl-CoA dehydrogenase family protein [unclassified Minwuia]|jgi:alkylation response protein AidB-like acyl-CoA dehydrogenase|uniref:acyl-CoA dehydrogenase family protein n=1 Tax=unclassified Minwuia TaxID=2618799 RepID=UPI002479E7F4|nr:MULTISPECIES: acyl-CoA dehydrogenase family protein [unclassified Minwuia]
MDLSLTPEEEAFRSEVRDFLDTAMTENAKEAGRLTAGVVSDFEGSMDWYRALSKKGWIAPFWPVEHGGTGWTPMQRYIFDSECQRASTPRLFAMGVRMVAPVIMKFGTPEQKETYLPKIHGGEHIWCQGYSEPGSGSDLASLQCRADRDGDDYVINGTKIWTTGAHHANMMFCLVRTSKEGKPQQGISFIVFPMDLPGIKVDPILTMSGDHEVNQVFFDDVRVPVANRIGPENEGWTVAKYLLEFERGGSAYSPSLHAMLEKLKKIAAEEPAGNGEALIQDADFRSRLADLEAQVVALEYFEKKTMSALTTGQNPGAASSIMKLRGSECLQATAAMTVEAISYYANPYEPETRTPFSNAIPVGPDHSVGVMAKHLNSRAATIYAGASEVQRNIMAKLVLGL